MSDLSETLEQLRLYLPKYLSPARQEGLWDELRSFPNNRTIYSTASSHDILQGDGWKGLIVINFETVEKKPISGLVLSNSCDIAGENVRAVLPKLTFVPIIRIAAYARLLKEGGKSNDQIDAILDSIGKQRITSLMYLPAIPSVMEDSVALFGDTHSQPIDSFRAGARSRLFRLSDFGFYLFLFKLSIHFTRMMEGVER